MLILEEVFLVMVLNYNKFLYHHASFATAKDDNSLLQLNNYQFFSLLNIEDRKLMDMVREDLAYFDLKNYK